jgi:hypothetical protein
LRLPLRSCCNGYSVNLVDSTITPNFKKRVLEEVKDALCLGISLVTGPMIRETAEIALAVKAWNPDFPIILGGWHPSLLPKQTLEAPYIDIVVRDQGEESLLEVVQHLENRAPLDLIPGVDFKRNGKLIFTTERPLWPIVDLPPKAHQLADFDAYQRSCGRRWAMYVSSLACPFNRAYCTNAGVYGRKWNALPPEQFVEETIDLSTRYGLELLSVPGRIVGKQSAEPEKVGVQAGRRRKAVGDSNKRCGMLKKNKVVLFYPPYDGPPLGAPLCLLSLAAPLLNAGFEVTVVDAAIDPWWLVPGRSDRSSSRDSCSLLGNYNTRHYLKVGITGWAQVNGWRGDTSIEKRVEYDLYYVRHWTLAFDLWIVLMTFFRGFSNKNAY